MTVSDDSLTALVPQGPRKLCERCARIDLESLHQVRNSARLGVFLEEIGRLSELRNSTCPLCKMLIRSVDLSRTDNDLWYSLKSYRSDDFSPLMIATVDTPVLGLDAYGASPLAFVVVQKAKNDCLRVLEALVDFDVIRAWISFCDAYHDHSSNKAKQTVRVVQETVQSIRFINCRTRKIEPAPMTDDVYAALSYVWGQGGEDVVFSTTLPDVLPDTIEDAIETTIRLGIEYLWIDRYCINQNDPTEKQYQVSRMDAIYSQAYITIIAAAGTDPRHGLPGVRRRRRSAQPFLQIGQHFLFNTLPDVIEEGIQASAWARRGWTYQESVLSNRRLIFTDEQAYFECSRMYCYEGVNSNGEDITGMPYISHIEGRNPIFKAPVAWEVFTRLEDYSQRDLTFASDILNGILGVLRSFEIWAPQIRHLMGVPLFPLDMVPVSGSQHHAEHGLTHTPAVPPPVAAFCIGLCWESRRPYPRRDGFPSWSWTGWFGAISWRTINWQNDGVDYGDPSMHIRARLRDNRIIEWADLFDNYFELAPKMSGELFISAWVVDVRFPESEQWDPDSYDSEVLSTFDGSGDVTWSFDRTGKTQHSMNSCIAIRLAYSRNWTTSSTDVCVIVAQDVGDSFYERIGYVVTKDFPIARWTNEWYDPGAPGFYRKEFWLR